MTHVSRNLRILRRMTAIHLALTLTYRGALLLFMAGSIVVPVVSLLVWRAAIAGGAQLPVDKSYLTTYFVVLSFVTMATSSWLSLYLSDDIRLGRLSSWIIRPASLLHHFVANNLAEKVLKTAMLLPIVGVLVFIYADSVTVPTSAGRWSLFAVSTVLAGALVFTLDVLVGSLAFWFDDTTALDRVRILLINVLSGAVVPLTLMPEWARGFVLAQPFRFMVSFPVELVTGHLSGRSVATGFALQLGYVVLACAITRAIWNAGLRAYSAVGA